MPVSSGCRLLLCSDGVSSVLDDDQLAQVLANAANAGEAAVRLVMEAREAGGTDDATAVVVDVVQVEESAEAAPRSQADVDTIPTGSRA
jgi:protein phosphatase